MFGTNDAEQNKYRFYAQHSSYVSRMVIYISKQKLSAHPRIVTLCMRTFRNLRSEVIIVVSTKTGLLRGGNAVKYGTNVS
jgi:hypothetical protein